MNRSLQHNSFAKRIVVASVLILFFLQAAGNANDKTVRVFFLVGQSNMEGKGNPVHLDTYKNDPLIKPTYASLKKGDQWRVRDDVWITYPTKARGAKHGALTVGYGTKGENSIGPEFGFGHTVGDMSDDPVLLIKIAWGGKSVAVDFRPPGAPPTDAEVNALWERAKKKKPKTTKEEARNRYGHYYRETIRFAKQELSSFESKFPKLKGYRPVLSGFIWHQGFNDKVNRQLRDQKYAPYTKLLTQFIKDIRKDLNAPELPFVIGELSTGGIPARGDFQVAQENVAKQAEFKGNVVFVKTAEYYDTRAQEVFEKKYWKGTEEEKAEWRKVGNDRPYHYLGSGKTYYLKGVAFGKAVMNGASRKKN